MNVTMARRSKGNVVVLQSGGPTPVINQSLTGFVREALDQGSFGTIYGAIHGMDGLLERRFIDLGRQPRRLWPSIARAPGAALGSARRKLGPGEIGEALDVLKQTEVRFLISIGGNDSAENAHLLAEAASASHHPLTVVAVPKTVDNDLPETDHCPGYGSAARFVALATMGAGRDAEALRRSVPVTVLEVMGRNAGWLPVAAALGKRDERDAPHLILTPETEVDENRVVSMADEAVRRWGFAVVVVAENLKGRDGPLGAAAEPEHVDEFGHAYHASPGRYLASLLTRHFKARVRLESPNAIQRSFPACVSTTDAAEAYLAGQAAARYALAGHTDCMVTLVREPDAPYRCGTGLAPLEAVAGKERLLPPAFVTDESGLPSPEFHRYAMPLIGAPLPRLGRLRGT